ncbi:MAG TPA: PilZ domain-containing protein [Terriglobales bacterium]|nr:PilZ domain-containing protein [Terriglobales bacterium]
MSSSPVQHERRAAQRFPFQIPVTLRLGGQLECRGITQDVSARGAFILTDSKVAPAGSVEFTLVLPPEITLTESMRVCCRGKALRVNGPGLGAKFGVAVMVEHYEFLPEPHAEPRAVERAAATGADDAQDGRAYGSRGYPWRA